MGFKDRYNGIIRPFWLIWLSVQFHWAALKDAVRKDGLKSLARPQKIRNTATARLFNTIAPGFIAYENTTVVQSLVSSAQGKILELGPGSGNQLQRYNPTLVDFIYGVEPNPQYGDVIATKLKTVGLEDKYKLLACGVEDSDVLRSEGVTEGSIDTILSIQVMCAVDDVSGVMKEVWKLLKPGGSFVFWEHVRNKDTTMAVAQACLNPGWSAFVGCSLTRNIKDDILAAGEWENPGSIEVADYDPNNCLPRIWGVLKKKT